jgi:hypothetical protein
MTNASEQLEKLVALVGDLQAGPTDNADDLEQARRLAARAVRAARADAAATASIGRAAAAGMTAPLGEISPTGMTAPNGTATPIDATTPADTTAPLSVSITAAPHATALARTSADSAQRRALEDLLAQSAGQPADVLLHRREGPAAAQVPAWANGRVAPRSLGPFLDKLGQPVWIDIYEINEQVRFVRSAGAAPFLSLPVSLASRLQVGPKADSYTLPEGSVWIASRLFSQAAPQDAYTGLRIRGGLLEFTAAVVINGPEIIVPAAVHCHLSLELDPEAVPAGSDDGADVRAAHCGLPEIVQVHIDAAGAGLPQIGAASLQVYGWAAALQPAAGAIAYRPDLGCLAVPMQADTATFTPQSVASRLFQPSGTAPVIQSAWALPVALVQASQLGEAAGAGSLLLGLGEGLRATWLQQPRTAALGPAVLLLSPAQLAIRALHAAASGACQYVELWKDTQPSRATLRFDSDFGLQFVAQAAGSEALLLACALDARMDRPVDVKGSRLTVRAKAALALLQVSDAGAFVLVSAELDQPARVTRVSLAIKNALFVTSGPRQCWLYARLDSDLPPLGACLLSLRQHALVPTLPDPYAANVRPQAAPDDLETTLLSLVVWRPDTGITLDFLLGGINEAAGPAGPGLAPDPGQTGSAGGAGAVGDAFAFDHNRGRILLDVSSHCDQFGVALAPTQTIGGQPPAFAVRELYLERENLTLLTLPAVQWEAALTDPDPVDPGFPPRLGFANSGVPSVIRVPATHLVAAHPKAALDTLVENFAKADPLPAQARFTLPFGMVASAILDKSTAQQKRGATLRYVRPAGAELEGGHQLSIRATDSALQPGQTAALRGHAAQLANGQPGGRSVLGDAVSLVFNSYLGASGTRPLVPVTRLDLSGYGESLFSDWRNPYDDGVAVTQARFDVLVGRTAHEVIQVRSWLFPYAVQVVRTITIERKNNAVVKRTDSGWQAVSEGRYDFLGDDALQTHPGVVKGVHDVVSIRDTGEIAQVAGTQLAAVRFDAQLDLDGADGPVAARGQLGYVQLSAGVLLSAAGYVELLQKHGPLGGCIDASIAVGGGGQRMRVKRVGAGVADNGGTPEFVMAAWGSPAFPGGGDWSFLRVLQPGQAPVAIPKDGVPLVRAGLASQGAPAQTSPYRFADPQDLLQPDDPDSDYGLLHSTSTQRAFFPRPKVEAQQPDRITSTRIPQLADAYCMAGATGLFPDPARTLPFPSAQWALRIGAGGDYRLEMPQTTFAAGVGRRTVRKAGSVYSDVDYSGATVTYEIDTTQPWQWRFALEGARKIMKTTALGDAIITLGDMHASGDQGASYDDPRVQLGGALEVVQEMLTVFQDLGMNCAMNWNHARGDSWSLTLTVPVEMPGGGDVELPPGAPLPLFILSDVYIALSMDYYPEIDSGSLEVGGQLMFAVGPPGLYATMIIELGVGLSTGVGASFYFLLGVGIVYKIGPLKGLMAILFFGMAGESFWGYGAGFRAELGLDTRLIDISVVVEGKLARVRVCPKEPGETLYTVGSISVAVNVTICSIFTMSFEREHTWTKIFCGNGGCPLPDVLP